MLVAEGGGAIMGVGPVTEAGRIGLNYVTPEARFRGVGKAMLRALEAHARTAGAVRCTLESTETARRFDLASGYRKDGAPIPMLGARA